MVALPKKALIALTSDNDVFYDDGKKSGLYWTEAVHPYHVFTKAGYQVDFVSETGTFGLDEHSLEPGFIGDEDLAEYKDKSNPIHEAFKHVKKASDVDYKDYSIFFAAGGHATLIDFPTATTLQNIATEVYAAGGVVAAVCHGPAIFTGIKDKATGELLVKGKTVTAFTDAGEKFLSLDAAIERKHLKTNETIFKELGANYSAPAAPFDDHSVIDNRVATGANPASAGSAAAKAVAALA